jgi:hypothetical protein
MTHREAAATGLCLAAILAPMFRPVCTGTAVQRKLAESTRNYRVWADSRDADAQCHLGSAYHHGQEVRQCQWETIHWSHKAAGQRGMAAWRYLAHAYAGGQGVSHTSIELARRRPKVFSQAALRCMRRASWMPLVAVVLLLASLVVAKHSEWLSCALIAGGGAAGAYCVSLTTSCLGWARFLVFAFFALAAVAYTYAAVMTAVRGRGRGSEPSQPPPIS